jgi:hypothetical protein
MSRVQVIKRLCFVLYAILRISLLFNAPFTQTLTAMSHMISTHTAAASNATRQQRYVSARMFTEGAALLAGRECSTYFRYASEQADPRMVFMKMSDEYKLTLPHERLITGHGRMYRKDGETFSTISGFMLHAPLCVLQLARDRVPTDAVTRRCTPDDMEVVARTMVTSLMNFTQNGLGNPTHTVYVEHKTPVHFYSDLELEKPVDWLELSEEERERRDARVYRGLDFVMDLIDDTFFRVYEADGLQPGDFRKTLWVLETKQNSKWSFHLHGEPFYSKTPVWDKQIELGRFMGAVQRVFLAHMRGLVTRCELEETPLESFAQGHDPFDIEGKGVDYTIAAGGKQLVDFGVYSSFQAMRMAQCCKAKTPPSFQRVRTVAPIAGEEAGAEVREAWLRYAYISSADDAAREAASIRASMITCFYPDRERVKIKDGAALLISSKRFAGLEREEFSNKTLGECDPTNSWPLEPPQKRQKSTPSSATNAYDGGGDMRVQHDRQHASVFFERLFSVDPRVLKSSGVQPIKTRKEGESMDTYLPHPQSKILPEGKQLRIGKVSKWNPPLKPGMSAAKRDPDMISVEFAAKTLFCPFAGCVHDSNHMYATVSPRDGVRLRCFRDECRGKYMRYVVPRIEKLVGTEALAIAWRKAFFYLPDADFEIC